MYEVEKLAPQMWSDIEEENFQLVFNCTKLVIKHPNINELKKLHKVEKLCG